MRLIEFGKWVIPAEDDIADQVLEKLEQLHVASIMLGYSEHIYLDWHQYGSWRLETEKLRLGKFVLMRRKPSTSGGAYMPLELELHYGNKDGILKAITVNTFGETFKKFKENKLLNFYDHTLKNMNG